MEIKNKFANKNNININLDDSFFHEELAIIYGLII
jgi:hypothetical protein